MNSRIKASPRNQNGFAWVAGLMLIGVIALVGILAQTAQATAVEKVNICHGTSSETNPWNATQIDASSLTTHTAHGDFLYEGPVKENGKPETGGDAWCDEHEPESPNIPSESQCELNKDLVIVSDEDTQVNEGSSYVTEYPHSGWVSTVTTLDSTNWIWNTEKSSPDDNGTHPAGELTFTREFEIDGTPVGAELLITADNVYEVSINGTVLGDDDHWQSVETYVIDASDLIDGTNVLTIVAANGSGETENPAGLNFKLTVESEDCPEPEATVNTYKFVCSDVADLPEYGAGGTADMSDELLAEWIADDTDSCEPVRWGFQWVNNSAPDGGNSNPGDETEIAGSPWSEPFYGSVTIPLESTQLIWFREVFNDDYIGFTGQTNDPAGDSAEFYCYNDALNFDNWDWINVEPGQEYNCIAWNVPLKPAEPNFCEGNLLVNGSFEEDEVTDGAMWQLFASIPGWMVDWMSPSEATPMFELQAGVNGWMAQNGDQYIELDSDRPDTQANTKVWQDIATDDEKTYKLTYQFSPRPGTLSADNTVEVYWNGVEVDEVSGDNGTGNTIWSEETVLGLLGGASTSTLEFRSVGTSNELGGFIDSVCLVEVEAEACRVEVVSLVGDEGVLNGDAVEAWNHPSWATNLNTFADWIWDTEYVNDPEVDEARTFAKSFWVTGPVNDATLTFAADNRYWIEINGDAVDSDTGEYNYGATQTLDVSSFIDANAMNTIVMKIENIGINGSTPESNPAAGIYQLIVNAEAEMCKPAEIYECSDGIDNDGDGFIDYDGGEGDPGCDSDEDNDEYNQPDDVVEYGPYCGDGEIDPTWEQCDPGLVSRDSISIDDAPSCNNYCQLDNQCSDLVVARIMTEDVDNYDPDNVSGNNSEDMTEDLFIGGGVEGTHNIPGGTWFPVVLGDGTVVTDGANYDSYEDVAGYAINRDNGQVRVRMHGSHNVDGYVQPTEHADGTIEIVHAYTNTSVLTDMKSQIAQNKLEKPFINGTGGSANDELFLGANLGDFWMTVSREDDGFRAEYEVSEDLTCEQCENEDHGWSDVLEDTIQGTKKDDSAITDPNRTDANEALGEADWVPNTGTNFYSLGKNGWITVSFDKFVPDVDGDDLSIHEGTNGQYPEEKASVEVSQDGDTWLLLTEEASNLNPGNVSYLDFSETGLAWIKYVRITDTTNYALHANDADGFDLDAIDATWELCEEPKGNDEGSITIDKVVVGEEANGDLLFDFNLSWLDQDVGASISGNDTPETFSGLVEGNYTITELINSEDDWYLTEFSCAGGEYSTDPETGSVIVYVSEGADVTCTFENTYRPESNGESCLVEGYKYDEEGQPLAGWFIGLEGYYYPEYSRQEIVIYEEQLIGSDVTDENGYYCIEGEVEGPGSNYSVYEIIQEGWENIGAEINDTPVFEYFNDGEIASVDVEYIGDGLDVNFINQLIETPNEPNEPNNNTSRSNSRRGGGSSTGRVLGATTEEGFCPFLKDYLHINMQNNPVEVNKAKAFFNSYLGKALILDGVFDKDMFAAAVEFQNMFSGDVLDTWVEEFAFLDDNATGYIYQTTKWKINSILCPGYEAFPDELIVANGTTVSL